MGDFRVTAPLGQKHVTAAAIPQVRLSSLNEGPFCSSLQSNSCAFDVALISISLLPGGKSVPQTSVGKVFGTEGSHDLNDPDLISRIVGLAMRARNEFSKCAKNYDLHGSSSEMP